ncbi:MAG: helix-turn-helix domain-containing protein [Fibrobacterota bacterium]
MSQNPIQTGPEAETDAQRRAAVIMRVRSGEITATEGARLLGISRQCYYEWERRALDGMVTGLTEKEAGRPEQATDPEKDALKQRVAELEKALTVAKQTMEVREVFRLYDEKRAEEEGRKDGKKKRR